MNLQLALLAPLDRVDGLLLDAGLVLLLPQGDRHQGVVCPVLPLHVQALRFLHWKEADQGGSGPLAAFFLLSASSVMIEQTLVVSLTHHLNLGQAPQENGTNTSIDSSIYEYSYNYKYDGTCVTYRAPETG